MKDAIETLRDPETGITAHLIFDSDPPNPRTEWDNAFTFTCFHSRYFLGDPHSRTDHAGKRSDNYRLFKDPDDLFKYLLGDTWDKLLERDDREYCRIGKLATDRAISAGSIKEMHRQRERDHTARITEALQKACPIFETLYLYDHSGLSISLGSFSCPWDSGPVGFAYITREQFKKEWGNCTRANLERARECLRGEVSTYNDYLTGQVFAFVIEDRDGKHLDSLYGIYGHDDGRSEMTASFNHYVAEAKTAAANEADRQLFAQSSGGD